jgi:hypothetical protein
MRIALCRLHRRKQVSTLLTTLQTKLYTTFRVVLSTELTKIGWFLLAIFAQPTP